MKRRPAVRRGGQAGHELGADRSRKNYAGPAKSRLASASPRLRSGQPAQAMPELPGLL